MEEGATLTNHNEKETPVSTSPDSGICDLDTQPEEQTKPSPPEATSSPPVRTKPFPEGRFRYPQSYDPFFFKYATDNRKLTLLKSLSQDSEYSLDTSLFDAEEFLADMGFAGGSDPTIPDRFLPSLMQRLSKFPESEMESLHHRIVQSIGCFRRKEGKRRLFRNLSMGKGSSVDHFGKNHLPCPSNNYPLLRSNTGPAEFPFDDATTSTYEVNNNSLKSGRLSSSDSGHHSMDSLKNEGEFPESPIAILVSSASVEQEDKSLEAFTDKGVQVLMNDEVPVDDLSADSETTAKQKSDGEFINTVQEIQKLTDDISDSASDNLVSISNESDIVTEKTEKDSQNASGNTEGSLEDSEYVRSKSVEETSPEIQDKTFSEAENLTSSLHIDKPALPKNTAMSSPAKRPLRRISNAQSYNPLRHSKGFGSLEHQNNINEDEDLDYELFGFPEPTPTVKENNIFNSINNHNPFKTLELDDVSATSGENCNLSNTSISNFESLHSNTTDSIPFSSNGKSFNFSLSSNADSLPFHFNNKDSSNMAPNRMDPIDSKSEKETHSFSKPKFNRDDSLTNFLSSMLDMSESESALKSPLNSLLESQSKSDSEVLQDNFSSEKFPVQYNFTKAQSTEALSQAQSFSPFGQNLNSEVKSVPDRSPNRKRRVLRRMSSSLQCYDDESYEDPNKSTVTESFQFSPTNPFLSPKLPLRHTKSGLHDSNYGHRSVQPCNSLPPMKLYNPYKIQNEISRCTNPFACTGPDEVQSNSDPEATKVYNHKKEKRNCKKRRYLPSADSDLYSNPWIRTGSREFPKFNTCDDICNHQQIPDTIFDCNQTHRYYICSCREANNSRIHFDEPYPECDQFYQRKSMASCTNCTSLSCHAFSPSHCRHSRNPISHGLPLKGSFSHYLWNSTPDVRFGYCNSTFKDYRGRPKLNSLHDLSKDHCENISPASSFCDETRFSDDVFFSEKVPYCFAHSSPSKQPETVKPISIRKLKVRMPQRQHSMSIDDPDDHPFPNRKVSTHRGNFQNSLLSKRGFLSGDSSSNPSSPPDGPSRKTSIVASSANVPDVFQKKRHNNDKPPSSSQMAQLPSSDSKINNSVKNRPQSPIKKNKNEELLERKIRIFSKFFTNLGNLSKSVQDRHSDNEHKENRDARFYDVIGTDKPRKPSIRNVFPRKCSTPPPEYYRQIDLHKTKTSSFGSSDESDSSPRTVRKLEYPIYENRVVLQPVSTVGKQQRHFKPLEFTSSVSMYINSEENKGQSNVHRKDDLSEMSSNRDASSTKSDENSRNSSQMSFKVVTKELEDLQQSIQKAKEMRISASKELHLLQELLSGDDNTEGRNEAAKEKKFPTVHPAVHLKDTSFSSKEIEEKQALKDLREKSKKEVLEDTSFWQEEIRKVKEETNQAWQEKLDRMESLLTSQEEELHKLQSENENLQKNMEFQRLGSPTCHCRSESGQNGFGRIDSAFEDDEEYFSHKPSIPIQSTRQECDRLQERLTEEEQRADQLKLLLNQKLIDFNKLQITLSKQTKSKNDKSGDD